MPLFGPKKVARIDFAYYWADHEAIYVEVDQLTRQAESLFRPCF
jgi:hypothetical protein